jgi:NAD+ synthase
MLHAVARAVEAGLPVIYVNMIGGQDELVYDGGSFAINMGASWPVTCRVFLSLLPSLR